MNDPCKPPPVCHTQQEVRQQIAAARQAGKRIGVVPTMGALHVGHLSLVDYACRECDFTLVTVFVNPLQFGPGEDFDKYPRTLERDCELLADTCTHLVFAPAPEEMYHDHAGTFVEVTGVTERFEGASRPGHLRGVATVVLKLFHITTPDVAYFGQKDFQQQLMIRRMTSDLDLPIEIRTCPIIREPDGLALSSRNTYLSAAERQHALTLSQSLKRAAELVAAGERNAADVLAAMHEVFNERPDVQIDYLALADPDTLADVVTLDRPTVALVAARVGSTRLIDNRVLEP